ncbi:endonuclease domain-containing protein [Candidatus Parcubacteria bacterium]|nr:endonuclease domain-containing protein [Candidatus Parcubacteria bacterium]
MTIIYNKSRQKETRRKLRQESTKAEKIMWGELRNRKLGVKFRRQYGIGHYIADFCCPEKKLVIEIDGGVHTEDEQICYDKERSKSIEELGFKVLRFWNEDIENNLDSVLKNIKEEIKISPPQSIPLAQTSPTSPLSLLRRGGDKENGVENL